MKKIATFACFLWLLNGVLLSQNPDGGQEFMIRGEIAGLNVGDTLRFERIGLPNWDMTPAFEVVVSMPGKFEYTGRQPHIEYYLMTCLPRTDKLPVSTLRGLTMIVDGGTVTVTGNRDWIYFSRVDGEAFGEQPLLREATKLKNSMQMERSQFLRQSQAAYAMSDSVKGRKYEQQYNEFQPKEDESKRNDELRNEFLRRYPSSPWSLVYWMERSSNTPIDTLEDYYSRLDTPSRNGHFGTLLRKKIDDLKRLLPGQPAPDFNVTLPDGTGENHKISELYAFAGFPYFILVSPDGKIVSRGFHITFFETKKILETQYDK